MIGVSININNRPDCDQVNLPSADITLEVRATSTLKSSPSQRKLHRVKPNNTKGGLSCEAQEFAYPSAGSVYVSENIVTLLDVVVQIPHPSQPKFMK
jgi:hypothetical protein